MESDFVEDADDFHVMNRAFGRETIFREVVAALRGSRGDAVAAPALLLLAPPGSGRTRFALEAARSARCRQVHYFSRAAYLSRGNNNTNSHAGGGGNGDEEKQRRAAGGVSPWVASFLDPKTERTLWSSAGAAEAGAAEAGAAAVIFDDVEDLKHYSVIKTVAEIIEAREKKRDTEDDARTMKKKKKYVYLFVVDHGESRTMSQHAQRVFPYFPLPSPTPEQFRAAWSGAGGASAIAVRTVESFFRARDVARALRAQGRSAADADAFVARHFKLPTDCTEHEKDAVRAVFRAGDDDITLAEILHCTDARNVALHLLENVPAYLESGVGSGDTLRDIAAIYARTDSIEARLMACAHTDSGSSSSSEEVAAAAAAAAADSSAATTTTAEQSASTALLLEMTTHLRIQGTQGLLEMSRPRATATETPQHTKVHTKHSMTVSELAFLNGFAQRLGLLSAPELLVRLVSPAHPQDLLAPVDSESSELWISYISAHPFLRDHVGVRLNINDVRRAFRYAYMRVGSASLAPFFQESYRVLTGDAPPPGGTRTMAPPTRRRRPPHTAAAETKKKEKNTQSLENVRAVFEACPSRMADLSLPDV